MKWHPLVWHTSKAIVYVCVLHCAGIAWWLGRWTHDQKVASLNPGRRIFFSRVSFVCWLLFSVCFTPMLPQWHVNDPGHSATNAGGRLHLNTHTPLTHRSWNGLTVLLPKHSVGTYQKMSSHATRQEILIYSCLSSLSHCGLILA